MVTVFLPMAPNPVMGGHVLQVSLDRVIDIDLTVEEGIRSIVTSGVATGQRTETELPEDVLERLNRRLSAAGILAGKEELEAYAAQASSKLGERARDRMSTESELDKPRRPN